MENKMGLRKITHHIIHYLLSILHYSFKYINWCIIAHLLYEQKF